MRNKRIFIAMDISDEARRACSDHIDSLRLKFRDVRVGWERPEKLHLTLKFLGNVNEQILEGVRTGILNTAAGHVPFDLRLSRPGVFPSSSYPRVLWLGLDDAGSATSTLYKEVEDFCVALGIGADARNFKPHITIGRIRDPARASTLIEGHLRTEIEPVGFSVAEIVLYESDLQPTGSVYSVVFKAGLGT